MSPRLASPRAATRVDADALDAALALHMAGVVRRDPEALGRLYDLSLGAVYALVQRVLVHPQDSEEVVADVYLQVWERAEAWNPQRGPVLAWLRTLAWSRALDHYRRRRREWQRRGVHPVDPEDSYALPCPASDGIDPMALHLDARAAVAALAALAPPQREVLGLVFGEGLSHADVAARTGWPLGTVKSHARRGLAALRAALGIDGGEA